MDTHPVSNAQAYLTGLGSLFGRVEATRTGGEALAIDAAVDRAVRILLDLRTGPRKAMLIGNGGSAAIVSHIQNDLFKTVGLRAMVFTEQPLLTALSNDDGYETVFRQPIERWGEAGDLLIAISSSGESNNILTGVAAARQRGCQVVTFSGFKPANRLRAMGDINFYVPSNSYGYVEMTHAVLAHCIGDFAAAR
jgi:D-sedoheptulose 7-phosphate isomerase